MAIPPKDLVGISPERLARIRQGFAQEMTAELRKELTPKIREQVEHDLQDEILAKARHQVKEELQAASPTPKERKAFREFVRETELDARAQAVVASLGADEAARQLKWSSLWRHPFSYLLGFGLIPACYALFQHFGQTLGFAAAVATYLVVMVSTWASTAKNHRILQAHIAAERKVSSDFLLVAEEAKAYRVVRAERLNTKKELDGLVDRLYQNKRELDQRYHPRVEDLEVAQTSVRQRFLIEEPSDADATSVQEFEERLAESEATPQVKPRHVES